MDEKSKIFVAGHNGLVGSAILNSLIKRGYKNIVTRNRQELNLLNSESVSEFFEKEKLDYVFFAAAKVGGIIANTTFRADFIYENLTIQNNIIHQCYLNNVKKLLFLGSTCVYPKKCPQPIKEEYLLTNTLEYTNEPYAIAKIAGIKMCESYNIQYKTNFLSVMPTNLYGPNDNFDLEKSHVLPALLRKIHLAKLLINNDLDSIVKDLKLPINEINSFLLKHGITAEKVEIWGSGKPLREFLWSEDMAEACLFVMKNIDFKDCFNNSNEIINTHINIGTGIDISIKELAELIKKIVGYDGTFIFNDERPDGTYRKLTDCSKLEKLGWKYKVGLEEGIEKMYKWYLNNNA